MPCYMAVVPTRRWSPPFPCKTKSLLSWCPDYLAPIVCYPDSLTSGSTVHCLCNILAFGSNLGATESGPRGGWDRTNRFSITHIKWSHFRVDRKTLWSIKFVWKIISVSMVQPNWGRKIFPKKWRVTVTNEQIRIIAESGAETSFSIDLDLGKSEKSIFHKNVGKLATLIEFFALKTDLYLVLSEYV